MTLSKLYTNASNFTLMLSPCKKREQTVTAYSDFCVQVQRPDCISMLRFFLNATPKSYDIAFLILIPYIAYKNYQFMSYSTFFLFEMNFELEFVLEF